LKKVFFVGLIKRAWLYITRKNGRSIILFAVLMLLAAFMTACLSVRSAADAAAREVRQNLGRSFYVTPHLDVGGSALWEYVELEGGVSGYRYLGPRLTDDVVDRIAQLDGIKGQGGDSETLLMDTGLKLKPGLWSDTPPDDPLFGAISVAWRRSVQMFVVTDSSLHPFFRNGALSLAEGRHLKPGDEHKVLISEDTAQRNGLAVGDAFSASFNESFFSRDGDPDIMVGELMPVEIVGIFRINFKYQPSEGSAERDLAENYMFTDFATEDLGSKYYADYADRIFSGEHSYGRMNFFVEDPEDLDGVIAQAKAIEEIDWKYFNIEKDETAYQAQIRPLETIMGLTLFLIIALFAGCALILYLIFAMWIRSRRREMGILRAAGVRRSEIIKQLLAESLLIAAVAFAAAFFLAGPVTDAVGDAAAGLAEGNRNGETYEVTYADIGGRNIRQVAADVNLRFDVNAGDFWIVCAAGAGIMILSIGISADSILRMSPRRILEE
jgi:ABC-type lipoprotein release transport system permease subunit